MNELKQVEYFKRFYKSKFYIGISLDHKNKGLSIERFNGVPYNKYDYDLIGEYSKLLWESLITTIKVEAKEKNKKVRIDELNHCAFSY